MFRTPLICALGALLGANALAQAPTTNFASSASAYGGSFAVPSTGGSTSSSLLPPANDECTAPAVVVGAGPFFFDTTLATTGSTGQANTTCNIGGTAGIGLDLWFSWTAPSSGLASLITCTQTTIDSKVAIYAGTTCPPGQAIACSDQSCINLAGQTEVAWTAVSGQVYMIQLGSFPSAAAGTGTFTVTVNSQLPCGLIDDGSTENALGFIVGGDLVWLQSFGTIGQQTNLTTVDVVYGGGTTGGSTPGNGSPARVAVWKDVNNDGNPSDAQLLSVQNTTVANAGTTTFNVITLPTPLSINGLFFIGVAEPHAQGQYVVPIDHDGPSPSLHRAWLFGNNNANPADLVNVANNAQQLVNFTDLQHIAGFTFGEGSVLIRYDCAPVPPGVAFCQPGASGVMACQCGNPAGAGAGCANTGSSGGKLDSQGVASLAADATDPGSVKLLGTNMLSGSTCIFLQGPSQIASGTTFGAGIRCVSGQLMRLYVKQGIVAGAKTVPEATDRSISNRTTDLFPALPITAGSTWVYQAYYRDPSLTNPGGSCPSNATFNITAGQSIPWGA